MASNRRILTKLAGELQATRTGMGSQLHGVYRGYTYVVKPGTGSGKKMMMVAFSVSNDQTPASVDVWGTMRAVLPSGGRIIPKGFSIAVYVPVRGGTVIWTNRRPARNVTSSSMAASDPCTSISTSPL